MRWRSFWVALVLALLLGGCINSAEKRWAEAELARIQKEWPIMNVTNPSIEQVDRWYITSDYTYWRFLQRVRSGEMELKPQCTSITYGYCQEKNVYTLYFTWITEQPNYGIGIFLQDEITGSRFYFPLEAQAQIFNARDERWGMDGYSIDLLGHFPLSMLRNWIEEKKLPRMSVLLNNGELLENTDYLQFFRDMMDPKLEVDVQFMKTRELPDATIVEKEMRANQERAKRLYDYVLWWSSLESSLRVNNREDGL